eukprot:2657868-Rhodomonas_salina.3
MAKLHKTHPVPTPNPDCLLVFRSNRKESAYLWTPTSSSSRWRTPMSPSASCATLSTATASDRFLFRP